MSFIKCKRCNEQFEVAAYRYNFKYCGKCKAIIKKEKDADYYLRNKEKIKGMACRYYHENKEKVAKRFKAYQYKRRYEVQKKWQQRNKEKCIAYTMVYQAIKNGKLVKPKNCQICKKEKELQAHHADYSKPLDVIFCCGKCHNGVFHTPKKGKYFKSSSS